MMHVKEHKKNIYSIKNREDVIYTEMEYHLGKRRHVMIVYHYLLKYYTLLEKSATWNHFCPVFRIFGEKGSQKGSLHVQEPKKVPYILKNGSKEPKKVLKMVLKTHLDPFREPLKVPPVGQQKNLFFF